MVSYLRVFFARLYHAVGYSWAGLRVVFASERAFRQEIALVVILSPVIFWVDVSGVGRALLVLSLGLILMAELVNTAIETVVDRISPDRHDLSKKAKDIGSAVVFIAFLVAILIWVLVLGG